MFVGAVAVLAGASGGRAGSVVPAIRARGIVDQSDDGGSHEV